MPVVRRHTRMARSLVMAQKAARNFPPMADTNPEWKYKSEHDLLIACVGVNFGEKPADNLEAIRTDRARTGTAIRRALGLKETDKVADVGSGCGFVTRAI